MAVTDEKIAVEHGGTTYRLVVTGDYTKQLAVHGDTSGFEGERKDGALVCPLTPQNAAALRERLPWLRPVPLGLKTSAGLGDRLGAATPGHVAAMRGTGVAPIFAQQSVRENTRAGRTPQQVLDDAMWGVFQTDWREPWGADADHMKTIEDIDPFVAAGYSFYTIDPSDHVDDLVETMDEGTLRARVEALPWAELDSSLDALRTRFLKTFKLEGLTLSFTERALYMAAAKYGGAVAHTARMARYLHDRMSGSPFDLEMSVDETETPTSLHEHFYIASELRRLGVEWVSLAPRFVGRFEKGVDYIGDLNELEENIAGHAAIMRYFSSSYKLSLHSGSDKFAVYPIAMQHTGGLVHLKTAGTSYLEALRVTALVEPALFREMLDFARSRYETDRATYHVSADLDKIPASADLADAALPDLLNQFDARQVLHVTFGSVIGRFGEQLQAVLRRHESEYISALKAHFDRHLAPFARIESK